MAITARSVKGYQVEIDAGNHTFISDEPLGLGEDAGPCPFDLLLASLASCTVITLNMYARRKNWPLEGVEVSMEIRSSEIQAPDGGKARSSIIDSRLTFHGPLSVEQTHRLEEIAQRCPVHRTLKGDIQILQSVSNLQAQED